jgi:hypothetical protein
MELRELYKLRTYRAIKANKHRRYVELIVVDGMAPSRAASLLTLNSGRVSRDPDIAACLDEIKLDRDPTGRNQIYETARRVGLHRDGFSASSHYPEFDLESLPFDGILLDKDGRVTGKATKEIDNVV